MRKVIKCSRDRGLSFDQSDSCFNGRLSPTFFTLLVPGHLGVRITQEGNQALQRQTERRDQSVSTGSSGDNVTCLECFLPQFR